MKGCNKKIDPSLEGRALEIRRRYRLSILRRANQGLLGTWATPKGHHYQPRGPHGTAANVVAITVNIHYTDGDKVDKSTDIYPTDGITMYYTPNMRPKTHVFTDLINFVGQAVVQVGNTDAIRVPAGKKRWYLTRRCTVGDRCKDASKEGKDDGRQNLFVPSSLPPRLKR